MSRSVKHREVNKRSFDYFQWFHDFDLAEATFNLSFTCLLCIIPKIRDGNQIKLMTMTDIALNAGTKQKWCGSIFLQLYISKKIRPRQDSNLQSSDPKSDALSIRPRGQL